MLTRIMTMLALVLAAGLIAAGCGGDDDETTTTTSSTTTAAGATGATGATGAGTGEPLSQEEFITQADAICAESDIAIDEAAAETFGGGGGQPSKKEQEQFVTDSVVPSIEDTIDGLSALTPPEGDEDQINELLDAAEGALAEIEDNPGSITEEGGPDDPFAEVNELAADYGLKDCAE